MENWLSKAAKPAADEAQCAERPVWIVFLIAMRIILGDQLGEYPRPDLLGELHVVLLSTVML
jgi:hypothetical protein